MATDTTGGYCPEHDRRYSSLEQCGDCRAARKGAVAAGSPKADTSAVRTVAARYRLNEAACWNYSVTAAAADDGNIATKWSAESGKWAGRADEIELRILEIEHDQWLVEQKRKLSGGGS